ncbi:hypothetical protein ACH4LK_14665 [Streptomyces lydicus]|uniref:hypothetical protein n=1 Tax=Streptomyces lydicus TaxID=47763 RepID=UPI0037AE487D
MDADDFKGYPEDRELYLRLLVERDGPPINALIERDPDLNVQRGKIPKRSDIAQKLQQPSHAKG